MAKRAAAFKLATVLLSVELESILNWCQHLPQYLKRSKIILLPLYKRSTKINKRDFLLLLWFVLKTNLKDCLKY